MALKVYYWDGFLGRSAGVQLMLTAAGVEYESIGAFPVIAGKCAVFGAQGINIAPPVVEDGDTLVSQSTAATMYIGQKHFPVPAGQDAVALMLMANIVDLVEGGIGKNQSDAEGLKAYLDGADGKPSRFSLFASAIERAIAGPYFFGAEPTYVDFFCAGAFGWATDTVLGPLKAKIGKDYLADYPKIQGVSAGIAAIEKIQALKLPFAPPRFSLTPESESLALFGEAAAAAGGEGGDAAEAEAAAE